MSQQSLLSQSIDLTQIASNGKHEELERCLEHYKISQESIDNAIYAAVKNSKICTNHLNCVNTLIRYNGNSNLQDRDGKSLLMIAAEKGYLELTRELIKAGANTNLIDKDGKNCLYYAIMSLNESENYDIVELLTNSNAKLETPANFTPILKAAQKGYERIVQILLQKGANVNALTDNKDCALHFAVKSGNQQMVSLLLKYGAQSNLKNQKGQTCFDIANDKILQILRAHEQKLINQDQDIKNNSNSKEFKNKTNTNNINNININIKQEIVQRSDQNNQQKNKKDEFELKKRKEELPFKSQQQQQQQQSIIYDNSNKQQSIIQDNNNKQQQYQSIIHSNQQQQQNEDRKYKQEDSYKKNDKFKQSIDDQRKQLDGQMIQNQASNNDKQMKSQQVLRNQEKQKYDKQRNMQMNWNHNKISNSNDNINNKFVIKSNEFDQDDNLKRNLNDDVYSKKWKNEQIDEQKRQNNWNVSMVNNPIYGQQRDSKPQLQQNIKISSKFPVINLYVRNDQDRQLMKLEVDKQLELRKKSQNEANYLKIKENVQEQKIQEDQLTKNIQQTNGKYQDIAKEIEKLQEQYKILEQQKEQLEYNINNNLLHKNQVDQLSLSQILDNIIIFNINAWYFQVDKSFDTDCYHLGHQSFLDTLYQDHDKLPQQPQYFNNHFTPLSNGLLSLQQFESGSQWLNKPYYNSIIPPEQVSFELHNEILTFQQEIQAFNSVNQSTFEQLIDNIKSSVTDIFKDADVSVYGSFATELCLPWSDIDIVVSIPTNSSNYFMKAADVLTEIDEQLKSKDWVVERKNITSAFVPVLKVICNKKFHSKRIDITVQQGTHQGLQCVKLVKSFLSYYECLKPLVIVLKQFIYSNNLNDTYQGGLSSYGLILMIVSYLQFKMKGNKISIDAPNLGLLLLDYLQFYGFEINYNLQGIIAYKLDDPSPRQFFQVTPIQVMGVFEYIPKLFIKDPLNHNNNVGRSTFNLQNLINAYQNAYMILCQNYACSRVNIVDNYNQCLDSQVFDLQPKTEILPSRQCCLLKRMFELCQQRIKVQENSL